MPWLVRGEEVLAAAEVAVTRKVNGVPTRITLPLRHPLRPGDTIQVSERWF